MICAGIDIGSRTIKVVLLESDGCRILGSGVSDQGVKQAVLAQRLLAGTLADAGLTRRSVGRIVATGYGRNMVKAADAVVSEIGCHARGVRHWVPDARTVIDIGGQDSKVIWLNADGRVREFTVNDRCAAGTGRFLEIVASRLELGLDRMGALATKARKPAAISSMCAVFAETEIVGLLAVGVKPSDIGAGVQAAIAARISSLAGRRLEDPVVFTGGVSMIPGMAGALGQALARRVRVSPTPRLTGALGAALFAAEREA